MLEDATSTAALKYTKQRDFLQSVSNEANVSFPGERQSVHHAAEL